MSAPFWRTKSLSEMTETEWESLCDGCGKCCMNTLEDEDTGAYYATNVACRLFCDATGRCGDYENRFKRVSECLKLTPETVADMAFLPETCGYRRVHEGKDLPDWHVLRCGDPEAIHRAGMSVRGRTVNESGVEEADLQDYIVIWPEDGGRSD